MKLYSSSTSPFVRMVKVAAKELMIFDKITMIENSLNDATIDITKTNPVGKIPAFTDGDKLIIETILIIDYLQAKAARYTVIPKDHDAFIEVTQLYAHISSALEAGILYFYESNREGNLQSKESQSKLTQRMERIFAYLEKNIDRFSNLDDNLDLAKIGLVSALGFFDFRLGKLDFHHKFSNLYALALEYEHNYQSFNDTKPFLK